MKKLIRNIYYLLRISTPIYIVFNYIKNFLPNYRKKQQCEIIGNSIYKDFQSIDIKKKWFTNNLYFLNKNLSGKYVNNLLEIGSYEGRSALFFAHIFKNAEINCVDTWFGSDEHSDTDFKKIESNFDKNVRHLINNKKLIKYKTTSDNFFVKNNKTFDLIYVDGDHATKQVLKDLRNSWSFLNNNGFLLIDDYMWWFYKDLKNNPASAINSFISENTKQIKKVVIWHQVLIQKKL